jgi:hypothetical protein
MAARRGSDEFCNAKQVQGHGRPNQQAARWLAHRLGSVYFFEWGIRRNSLEPDLPPIGVDASRAEHAAVAISGLTENRIKYEARGIELLHCPCFLINDSSNPLEYPIFSATVWNHLGVEEKAAIFIFGVQSSEDFPVRLYADKLARSQV